MNFWRLENIEREFTYRVGTPLRRHVAFTSAVLMALSQGCSSDQHIILTSHSYTPSPRSGSLPVVGAYDFEVNSTVSGSGCVNKEARFSYIGFVGGIRFDNTPKDQAVARATSVALASKKEGDLLFLTRGMITELKTKVCAEVFGRALTLTKASPEAIAKAKPRRLPQATTQPVSIATVKPIPKVAQAVGSKSSWRDVTKHWLYWVSGSVVGLGLYEINRGQRQIELRNELAVKEAWTAAQETEFLGSLDAEYIILGGQVTTVLGFSGLAYAGVLTWLANR